MPRSSESASSAGFKQSSPTTPPPKLQSRTKKFYLILLGLIIVLALALGLGLGLGLKHHSSASSTSDNSTSAGGDGSDDNGSLPKLQTTPKENFVLTNMQSDPPKTRTYDFLVGEAMGSPDGFERKMLVVNGMYPGPTIEANQYDRVIVNVTNNLTVPTAIHWHGLFQNGTNFYDGTESITQCGIPPGDFLVYNFTFGEFSGTTWWHAHYSTQYTDGITGGLVVYPSPPTPPTLTSNTSAAAGFPTWDHEVLVQMSDYYHTFSTDLLDQYLSPNGIDGTPGDEPVPESGTLNGMGQWGGNGSYFDFTFDPNKTYRIRLVNTGSFANIRFSIDNHPLTVIEVDGTLVQPYTVTSVNLAVAQRYSVLVTTNQTQEDGTYWMRSTVQSDMFTYTVWGQNTDIRGIVRYSNAPNMTAIPTATDDPGPGVQGLADMDIAKLVPAARDVPPKSTKHYTVTVSLKNTADFRFLAFFNNTSWEPLQQTSTLFEVRKAALNHSSYAPEGFTLRTPDQLMITEEEVQVVDLLVNNLDDGDHPFHMHGHRPYIMGTDVGRYIGQDLNEVNPLRRDTMLIPAYSWMILRFTTDNPGLWAFHCHISWHMASGLLMQINSLPSVAAQLPIPQRMLDQCVPKTPAVLIGKYCVG